MDLTPSISYSGWAMKLGARVKNWKRRWFVLLSNGKLRYFEDKNAYQEKGHLQINKKTSISIAPATSAGVQIQIVNDKRTLIMTLPTQDEAEQWSSKLINIIHSNIS